MVTSWPVADTADLLSLQDRTLWDAYVNEAPDACNYHQSGWLQVVRKSFGHRFHALWARDGSEVLGILPLVHMKSVLFGNFLTSLPFYNYGGVLSRDQEVSSSLLSGARLLMNDLGAEFLELRQTGNVISGLPSRNHKVSMHLSLKPGSEDLWNGFKAKVRNQVRKAIKSGLTVNSGRHELLDDFYAVFARNMRDLGTPVYSKSLFANVLDQFPDNSRIFTVNHPDGCVAGAVGVWFRGTFETPWASSIRNYNSLCPNNLMYWEMIRYACGLGCRRFDFGRSTPNKGTYRFKKQWGAKPVDLHWQYLLSAGHDMPNLNPDNPKYRLLVKAWQKLPVGLTRIIGPGIVRNIP